MNQQQITSNHEELRPGDVIDLADPGNNGLLTNRTVRYGGASSAIDIAPGIEVYVSDLLRSGWDIVAGRRAMSPRELATQRIAQTLRDGVLKIPEEVTGAGRGRAILDLAPHIMSALMHDGWRMSPSRASVERLVAEQPLGLSENDRARFVDAIMKLIEGEEG